MERMTQKELKLLLPNSLNGIWEAVKEKKRFGEPIDKVASLDFETPEKLYYFLEEHDPLTDALYTKISDTEVIFPFATSKVKDGVSEFVGRIGDQTSDHHRETICQHTAIVIENMGTAGINKSTAMWLGLFHDVGKKYTLGTNKKGQVCFYGHETVGAFFAGRWAMNMDIDERYVKQIVAVAYGHLGPHNWKENPEKEKEFLDELTEYYDGNKMFARQTMGMIYILYGSDDGIKPDEEVPIEKVETGFYRITHPW